MKEVLIILSILLIGAKAFSQAPYQVSGVDTVLTTAAGYNLYPRTSSHEVEIYNSHMEQTVSGTYLLQAGDDGYNATTAHNLDGAKIKGNYFDYTGTTPGGIHGIMCGYNVNYDIAFNYFDQPFYGLVHEGGYNSGVPMKNTGGGIRSNIFRNCPVTALIWGYDSTYFTNNTVYNGRDDTYWTIQVGNANGTTTPANSKNTHIVNNIFYHKSNPNVIAVSSGCDTGLVIDYNIYYIEDAIDNEPQFNWKGSVLSWDQWQDSGYDVHSVILDPDFIDTVDFVPSSLLEYGTDLGGIFQYTLSTDSEWTAGNAPDTIQQTGTWQVGAVSLDLKSNIFYVQDTSENSNASDSNTGNNPELPWATWQHAFDSAEAGDTVWFMDGVWTPDDDAIDIVTFDPHTGHGNDGTASNPINFLAYPGAAPVLDCNLNDPPGVSHSGLKILNAEYTRFKGLTVRNLRTGENPTEIGCEGIIVQDCGKVWMENVTSHDIGGRAWWIRANDTIYLTNCDAYNACDSLDATDPGGDADGFNISSGVSMGVGLDMVVYITGCRAWNCSDDGFDISFSKSIYIDSTWAFFNGTLFEDGYDGDGVGIKYGMGDSLINSANPAPSRLTSRSLLIFNEGAGLEINNTDSGGQGPYGKFYNNTIYNNGRGFNGGPGSPGSWDYPTDSGRVELYNNLIYKYTEAKPAYSELLTSIVIEYQHLEDWFISTTESWSWMSPMDTWFNRYNPAYTITDDDFSSLDSATIYTQLSATRKSDGSLPDITVLKLTEGSDLINGGTDVGYGDDLGAYQYSASSPQEPGSSPRGGKAISSNGLPYYRNGKPIFSDE